MAIFRKSIHSLTEASTGEVTNWVKELEIDDISEGYMFGQPKVAPKLKVGYFVYSIWWD